jgi:large conductance mechanosensitive channel
MGFIQEFKDFAVQGNMVDLAVGVIIGGAFGKIVSSVVSDVIMPPIGVVMGGVNFTDLKYILKPAEAGTAAVTLNYGNFLQVTVDFLIVAFCVFLLVKGINSMRRPQLAPEPTPLEPTETALLSEIRDLLKTKSLQSV